MNEEKPARALLAWLFQEHSQEKEQKLSTKIRKRQGFHNFIK